jgi:hypothetical protein
MGYACVVVEIPINTPNTSRTFLAPVAIRCILRTPAPLHRFANLSRRCDDFQPVSAKTSIYINFFFLPHADLVAPRLTMGFRLVPYRLAKAAARMARSAMRAANGLDEGSIRLVPGARLFGCVGPWRRFALPVIGTGRPGAGRMVSTGSAMWVAGLVATNPCQR